MLYEAERSSNARDYLIILLLYGSGIRCAELCGLQWADVQETPQGGQITVLGKRNKTRAIALHPTAWNALQSFKPDTVSGDDYVFQSRQTSVRDGKPSRRLRESQVWRIVSTIAEKAGIRTDDRNVSPHWFRHAHATHAMQKNTP
jgi:integrase/recombinase XerD